MFSPNHLEIENSNINKIIIILLNGISMSFEKYIMNESQIYCDCFSHLNSKIAMSEFCRHLELHGSSADSESGCVSLRSRLSIALRYPHPR